MALGLYQFSIAIYVALIRVASLWNEKAKLMIAGRKNWTQTLKTQLASIDKPLIWVHCASLGEFEMARPIIEHLRGEGKFAILITFFSPSGYEIRKNYNGADLVMYLPFDTGKQAEAFVEMTKPAKAIFVKYELWLGYIRALSKYQVEHYLIGAHFKPDGIYFKWYGGVYRNALRSFTHIFTQTKEDIVLLMKHHINHATCAGDPRYDRVWQNAQKKKENATVSAFVNNRTCMVLGSSYTAEEQLTANALPLLPEDLCLIIAPHEVNEQRIQEISSLFSAYSPIRYSQANHTASTAKVLIIDNVGMLADIYQYAQIAFVGGGFGKKGIHNILEPLAMGCFVLVGPNNHHRFPEVPNAVHAGVASVVDTAEKLASTVTPLISYANPVAYLKQQSTEFISEKTGASNTIIHKIS